MNPLQEIIDAAPTLSGAGLYSGTLFIQAVFQLFIHTTDGFPLQHVHSNVFFCTPPAHQLLLIPFGIAISIYSGCVLLL